MDHWARIRMSKKWRLTDRTRTLLTLEMAIVLPAAALMGFSIWNLKHIQRDKAIEAAIQRDFSYVLKIAEKESWEKANDLVRPVRKEFPEGSSGARRCRVRRRLYAQEFPARGDEGCVDRQEQRIEGRCQSADHDDPPAEGFQPLAGVGKMGWRQAGGGTHFCGCFPVHGSGDQVPGDDGRRYWGKVPPLQLHHPCRPLRADDRGSLAHLSQRLQRDDSREIEIEFCR